MFNKNFLSVTIFGLLFFMATTFTAQDKPSEKKADQTSMQMNRCMDKIASDGHMRGEMMTKMMDHMKGDSTGMMKMGKTMMSNPGMRSMMMKMMPNKSKDGKGMMMKGKKMKHNKEPEVDKKSDHEKHH